MRGNSSQPLRCRQYKKSRFFNQNRRHTGREECEIFCTCLFDFLLGLIFLGLLSSFFAVHAVFFGVADDANSESFGWLLSRYGLLFFLSFVFFFLVSVMRKNASLIFSFSVYLVSEVLGHLLVFLFFRDVAVEPDYGLGVLVCIFGLSIGTYLSSHFKARTTRVR